MDKRLRGLKIKYEVLAVYFIQINYYYRKHLAYQNTSNFCRKDVVAYFSAWSLGINV